MDGRFLKLRTIVIAGVIAVFALSIHPLTPRDFYETFRSTLRNEGDPVAEELISAAQARQERTPGLNPATALLEASEESGTDLSELVEPGDYNANGDVVAMVRKAASSSIRPGLDLAGGVEFVLELEPEAGTESSLNFNQYRDLAAETLRKRLESQNIFESEISSFGSRALSLKAPLVSKDEKDKLLRLVQMSCKLAFRLVHPESDRYAGRPAPVGYEWLQESEEMPAILVSKRVEMDGKMVAEAIPMRDQFGQLRIALRFSQEGAARFGEITAANVGRQLAIVLDGKLYCAPVIRDAITGGSAEISGSFSNEEAQEIADALNSGSFPFKIKVVSVYDTAPSLGADNIRNGVFAGILALVLLTIFMCIYYLRAGVIAVIALAVNIVLILGAMAAFGATMTMPGIAGIILTLGMAVDANVLIFERIREELNRGKSLAAAIDLGYEKAFSAVIDGNLTTLLCAVILMMLGSGPVKGFAVSLTIGLLASLFTAVCMTRLIFDYALRFWHWKSLKMCHIFERPNFDFLSWRRCAFLCSGILVLASLGLFAWKGERMLGVEFTGGTLISCNYDEAVPSGELEKQLQSIDGGARIVYKTNPAAADNRKLEILLRGGNREGDDAYALADEVVGMLNDAHPQLRLTGTQVTSVGGLVGAEALRNSAVAILLALLGMSVYVALRYELSFAAVGVLALVHDVIISLGIFILLGRELSLPVVAALLTIIGYSINDTIVIFDRIREDARLSPQMNFRDVINHAINQTMSRTLLTSFTTFLVVAVMFCFGGIVINDFVLVMMLGIVIGTYSSIFIASPAVVVWHRKIGVGNHS